MVPVLVKNVCPKRRLDTFYRHFSGHINKTNDNVMHRCLCYIGLIWTLVWMKRIPQHPFPLNKIPAEKKGGWTYF